MTDGELSYLKGMLGQFKETVLAEFKDNREDHKEIFDKIDSLKDTMSEMSVTTAAEISALKVKAGAWGAIGGIIPSAIAIIYVLVKGEK